MAKTEFDVRLVDGEFVGTCSASKEEIRNKDRDKVISKLEELMESKGGSTNFKKKG